MAKKRWTPWFGMRHPRYVKGYPLEETTGVRRYKKHAVKRSQLRQPRPRIHARGPFRVRTIFDTEAARRARAANVQGSVEERIFYQALIDRGLMDGVDFTYQAAEFGGRAELGGLVADFIFPIPSVVVQVQSYWHRISLETERRDTDQSALLQAAGYTVLEIWSNNINDPAALEDWMDRNIDHLWGTSSTPLTGATERDEAYLMSVELLNNIEERLHAVELALMTDVVMEAELDYEIQHTLKGFDVRGEVDAAVRAINIGGRLATLEQALFSGGGGGPAVRISSAYIAQHLSSSNYEAGVAGWRISRDGNAEFQDLTARGSMQSDNFVSGSEGWRIYEDGDAEFHDVTVRGQIIASTFKYDAVSTMGGAVMLGAGSNLSADVAAGTTTLPVVDAQFSNGDFLYTKMGGTYEVMEVTGGGGTQSLTVTRGIDGVATAWKAGTTIVRKGNRILLDTVAANSPYMDIISFDGPDFDDETVKVRLGNLAGISDPYMTPTGYGLYSDNVFLSGTAVFASGTVVLDDEGVTIAAGLNDNNFVKWDDSGNITGQIQSWEDVAGDRSIQLKVFPSAIGTDNVAQMLIAPFGGGETGCPALTLHGQVDSADPLQAYIRLDAGVGIAGATQLVVYEDGVYILNGLLRGISSQYPDLGTTTVAEKWGDIFLHQAKKIYFDDDNDTYMYASGDDILGWFIGGAAAMALSTTGLALNENFALITGKKFYFDSDLDSYITCTADDTLKIYTLSGVRATFDNSGFWLAAGTNVNDINTSVSTVNHNALVTEGAVKNYADAIDPMNPKWACFLYLSSNRTHTNNTAVPWSAVAYGWEHGGNYWSSGTRMTVPSGGAGWYIITGRVNVSASGSDTYVQGYIKRNGIVYGAQFTYRSGGGSVNANVCTTCYMSVGDYVELFPGWSAAGTRTLIGGVFTTWFSMVRITRA